MTTSPYARSKLHIETSSETLVCPGCRGAGTIACLVCCGRGSENCAGCNGTFVISCPVCRGEQFLSRVRHDGLVEGLARASPAGLTMGRRRRMHFDPYFVALVSLICPGIGQALNGEAEKGVLYFALAALLAATIPAAGLCGIGLALAFWSYCAVDGFSTAGRATSE